MTQTPHGRPGEKNIRSEKEPTVRAGGLDHVTALDIAAEFDMAQLHVGDHDSYSGRQKSARSVLAGRADRRARWADCPPAAHGFS